MIAGRRRWSDGPGVPPEVLASALDRYCPGTCAAHDAGRLLLFASSRDWIGSARGVSAALCGWIDNADELAAELGIEASNPAAIYAAALAQWGVDADRRIIGSYAAIGERADGTIHLARSPWDAPPLYYHVTPERLIASPLLRVLFADGAPREPDFERMIDLLAYDWRSLEEASWYRDIAMVPLGASVQLSGGQVKLDRWYRPPVPQHGAGFDERAAVEQARELLDEAAAKALRWAGKPALALSGGLDSPLVASALLRAMPGEERLTAITFAPDRNWRGEEAAGLMGDERALVGELVASHPRIDWHVSSSDIGPPDRRAREVFAASEVFAPGLANVGMLHGVYEQARALGCDTLLTADFGNSTFSEAGRAAYCEYWNEGEWEELVALLRARFGDERPLWRKLLALSILPQLPPGLRRLARGLAHPQRRDMGALITALSPSARSAQARRAALRGTQSAWQDFTFDRARAETVMREFREADSPGRDVDLAFEQIHNVRKRDVATYRPLVEFCLALPTRAFARGGLDRRLARLMGEGRVPDSIRLNRRHGQHNIDWHARMTPALPEMRRVLETAREHQFLGSALDIDRLLGLIDDWPEAPDFSWERDWPRMLALPRAVLAARFIGHVENRNDL